MNKQLNEIQEKAEKNVIKNEQAWAIVESMKDTFDSLIKISKNEETRHLTAYELERVYDRTNTFFYMLNVLLQESNQLNDEAIEALSEVIHGTDERE